VRTLIDMLRGGADHIGKLLVRVSPDSPA
jgi:hypothetical protein